MRNVDDVTRLETQYPKRGISTRGRRRTLPVYDPLGQRKPSKMFTVARGISCPRSGVTR